MALATGARLGTYEITGHLGSGGMGEVYRARDSRLGREVAIKVMPDELHHDAERLARFEREARVLGALNHSNVATLYGFETHEGAGFLVMELVEGETLADRIARGPVPVGEALPLFVQIAEGLEAAHAKGIIHRDLKPANIKVREDGAPKILDFGLAKALAPEPAAVGDAALSASPTLTQVATRRGEILGTAAYMSPEQARGLECDPRADVWGFGCCLYEALTGRRPFSGGDAAQTLASVLKDEPDWDALPSDLPANVGVLLRRCLEKSRRARLQAIGDARLELAESLQPPARLGPLREPSAPRRGRAALWTAAAIVLAVIAGSFFAGAALRDRSGASNTVTEPLQVSIELPADLDIRPSEEESNLRISADGRAVYLIAGRGSDRRIYTRSLDDRTLRPVPGTEGLVDTAFMVSPDGDWVGFHRAGTLWKVRAEGGAPVALYRESLVFNPHWGEDGFVYFAVNLGSGILRVSEDGGPPQTVTELDASRKEFSHEVPLLLPGGAAVLFRVHVGNYTVSHLEAALLATGERRRLEVVGGEGLNPRPLHASRTHLVYSLGNEVFAAPFDADDLRLTGPGVPVLTGVESTFNGHAAIVAVSRSGTLAYLPGPGIHDRRLVWKDRAGAAEPVELPAAVYHSLDLAHDGSRAVLTRFRPSPSTILTLDLRRGITDPVTVSTGAFWDNNPRFSPSGREIAFASNRNGPFNLFAIDLDAGGEPRPLHPSASPEYPGSWSPDGRFLTYAEITPSFDANLWALPLGDPGATPLPIAGTPFGEANPRFSPDGRFVAYMFEVSGRYEIFVARFDPERGSVGRPEPASSEGGWLPVWSRDGRELYFRNGNGSAIMKVDVLRTDPELELDTPQVLFEEHEMFAPHRFSGSAYDVAPDGRFLMLVEDRSGPKTIHVVLNWLEELERLVPAKR